MLTARVRPELFGLLASSALALGFLGARIVHTQSGAFSFLAFNLALAWVPLACAWLTEAGGDRPISRSRLIVLGIPWLLFFPNAPYLVTDFVHLRDRPEAPLWFDIAMLSAFAWAGMLLGLRSLATADRIVRRRLGRVGGWVFVASIALLTGLGIYLGRFLRINSWDVLLAPHAVLAEIGYHVAREPRRAAGVTAAFGALTWVGYLSLLGVGHHGLFQLGRRHGRAA